jgi:hypothetical protein
MASAGDDAGHSLGSDEVVAKLKRRTGRHLQKQNPGLEIGPRGAKQFVICTFRKRVSRHYNSRLGQWRARRIAWVRPDLFTAVLLIVRVLATCGEAQAAPVVSAIRYTLEIEVDGQKYTATSVVQRTAVPRSELPPSRAGSNAFKWRGEGLGFVLEDGRAFVAAAPEFMVPPGYDVADASKVARFVTEGRTYPVRLAQPPARTNSKSAFIFDNAVAPKTAWKFDWLNPGGTLGPGARIVRYDMMPTDDPPTFDLGKVMPWIVTNRQGSRTLRDSDDEWYGFQAFRARVKQPEVRSSAKPVEMSSGTSSSVWLDATDSIGFGIYRDKFSDMQPIGVRYSEDLTRVTLLPQETAVPPTVYVQQTRIPKHRPGKALEFWSPAICISGAGCANILDRGPAGVPAGALIDPTTELVYLVDLDRFTTDTFMFQMR